VILTVIGNRPQFVKAAAVGTHLRGIGDEVVVHTGQHYDRELSEIFFEELEMAPPAHQLDVGSGTHAEQTAKIMTRLEPVLAEVSPDAVLVYGDTNSTLAAALVAAKLNVPSIHVEAGMRSFDRSTPEEVNRIVADSLGDLLLCSTQTAVDNLVAEGRGPQGRLVGDVMADVAFRFGPIAERRSLILERLELEPGSYAAATAHRAENVDDPANLSRLVTLLTEASRITPIVLPLHPRTRARLEAGGWLEALDNEEGLILVDPLGYLDFTCLLRTAKVVLTDSGGAQKEAYLAGVPCVTMRERTEWVETVESGWNTLVGLDAKAAAAAMHSYAELEDAEPPDPLIYGDGDAGERVAEEIRGWFGSI